MTTSLPHGACRLDDWGLIRAEGPDAASFLHSQLTQSVTDLPTDQARLGGYCSAKGRLMANFALVRESAEGIALILPRDVLPALLKRLSMFVLRAKVKLRDASDETPVWGVIGAAVPALSVWGVQSGWIRLPDAEGHARAWHLGDPALEGAESLPRDAWDWAEVHAGLAWVRAATAEHFVPQMLNWELVGGVNFKKGCYPGQEVVARSQYRGTLKRRGALLAGAAVQPGQELFHSADPQQPAGLVALAGELPGVGPVAFAEVKIAALEAGTLHAGAADGPVLHALPLPYPVDTEVV